jgi:hypothetical protein
MDGSSNGNKEIIPEMQESVATGSTYQLAADFSGGPSEKWVSGTSTLKFPDSLLYAEVSMGGGTLKLFTLTWYSQDSSELIDTVSGDFETEALQKQFSIGMVFHKHH